MVKGYPALLCLPRSERSKDEGTTVRKGPKASAADSVQRNPVRKQKSSSLCHRAGAAAPGVLQLVHDSILQPLFLKTS